MRLMELKSRSRHSWDLLRTPGEDQSVPCFFWLLEATGAPRLRCCAPSDGCFHPHVAFPASEPLASLLAEPLDHTGPDNPENSPYLKTPDFTTGAESLLLPKGNTCTGSGDWGVDILGEGSYSAYHINIQFCHLPSSFHFCIPTLNLPLNDLFLLKMN